MPEKEKNKKKQTKKKKPEEMQEILPPLDFSSLVLPFFTQAVIKLGLAKDPLTNKEEENLELAKRSIDLLELLKRGKILRRLSSPAQDGLHGEIRYNQVVISCKL